MSARVHRWYSAGMASLSSSRAAIPRPDSSRYSPSFPQITANSSTTPVNTRSPSHWTKKRQAADSALSCPRSHRQRTKKLSQGVSVP